ncbi:hypothetical protein [Halobacterium jilantaiense]|uniref:Uncharacterized protein n=1 Tax=Halobacterium jilantaiense TaxID=355548 RepID=A0A1I0Q4Q0_9EURY|nr:hypothetical protein [Halobacterium jilantaiense]SEW21887.1 hypothetical protein SAMN04487945_2271 [Halobacterium jilantaiense]
MDDALQRRLDRLTWLVAGLLVAVLALGFHEYGNQYLSTLVAVLVFGGLAVVALTVVWSLGDLAAGDDA